MHSVFVYLGLLASAAANGHLDLLYKWRSVDFEYPTRETRDFAIRNGSFVPGNSVPLDVDFWEHEGKKKMFVTIPRFQAGIPASLATISEQKNSDGHLLKPYPPDWSWHVEGRCEGITSAFRTQIDKCGRLWVIDSGVAFTNPRYRLCQPQLLAFSLHNDKLAGIHKFPEAVLWERSVLCTLAVDVLDPQDKCRDTHVYVADVTGFSLIVFDAKKNKSWRVKSNTMFPYPPQGVFQTNNVEFDLMDGILGMALTTNNRGDRTLYYHAFASLRESWVSTAVLNNESLHPTTPNTLTLAPRKFKMSEEARPSQTASEVFDRNGNLFFGPVAQNTLMCWNSERPFTPSNIHKLVHDDSNLQFITGIKVREDSYGNEELYVLTDRFHLVMVGKMNPREVNIRIMKGNVADLVRGSGCAEGRKQSSGGFTYPKRPSSGYGTFG